MDWSNTKCLRFLELYKDEPVIWNTGHSDYGSKADREAAWVRIADQLIAEGEEATVKELKRKKDSLMAVFRSLVRKTKGSASKTSWFAYELMASFLLPFYNIRMKTETEINESSEIPVEDDIFVDDGTWVQRPESSPDYSSHSFELSQSSKRRHTEVEDATETEFDVWVKSLAKTLNNMDLQRALRLQLRIQTIVTEERIQHLQKQARQNNLNQEFIIKPDPDL